MIDFLGVSRNLRSRSTEHKIILSNPSQSLRILAVQRRQKNAAPVFAARAPSSNGFAARDICRIGACHLRVTDPERIVGYRRLAKSMTGATFDATRATPVPATDLVAPVCPALAHKLPLPTGDTDAAILDGTCAYATACTPGSSPTVITRASGTPSIRLSFMVCTLPCHSSRPTNPQYHCLNKAWQTFRDKGCERIRTVGTWPLIRPHMQP